MKKNTNLHMWNLKLGFALLCFICFASTALGQDADDAKVVRKPISIQAVLAQALHAGATQEKALTPEKAQAYTAAQMAATPYVDTMQNYYDKAMSYSANFVQDYETVDGIKKTSSGIVWFKKPGLMRWDYQKPESRFLLSDGKYFWSWEPVYRQYCRQDLDKSQLPSALSFLSGTGRIGDDFTVSLDKVKEKQVSLKLVPKQASISFAQIDFELLMPEAKVFRVTIYDAMGNKNRITLKQPEINGALDDKSFRFTPPADAKHICE